MKYLFLLLSVLTAVLPAYAAAARSFDDALRKAGGVSLLCFFAMEPIMIR